VVKSFLSRIVAPHSILVPNGISKLSKVDKVEFVEKVEKVDGLASRRARLAF
jgi:hypothetical protein